MTLIHEDDAALTPDEIALVRAGFARIAPAAEAVGLAFYAKLFELDPSLRSLFAADLRPQVGHLMTALTMVVRSLDDLTPLLPRLRALGRSHFAYGVMPLDFATVGAALLATLEPGLGDDFTPAARDAWSRAYQVLADVMIAGMAEATSRAA
jgi:hemoglobin-like flavoprotein